MDPVNQRFRELANKDITDEELIEELRYTHAKIQTQTLNLSGVIENVKQIRNGNIYIDINRKLGSVYQFDYRYYVIENYEMKQRIRYLEQTLKTFMEQTKAERLSQEAVNECLSKEMDEFYDCQSDGQERVDLIEDALKETIELVWKLEAELRTIKDRTPVKDKMA